MDPFHIFLPEVWEKIIEKVNDPQDRLNLIWTNSQLEREFHNKKVEWSFAAVLPIIMSRYETQNLKQDEEIPIAVRQCRLVSSECCKAVERYVEKYWDRSNQYGGLNVIIPQIRLESRQDIDSFLEKIKDTPPARCPVVRRDMHLRCKCSENEEDSMVDRSIQLMEKIGKHLYSISVEVKNFPNLPALIDYLESLLQQLPNLRCLNYDMMNMYEVIENFPSRGQQIQPLQLPPALHLRKLELLCDGNYLEKIDEITDYICFKGYFPQITHLTMDPCLWKEAYNNMDGLFPNLQVLNITGLYMSKHTEDAQKVTELLRNLDAPQIKCIDVESVSIRFRYSEDMDECALLLKQKGDEFLSERYPTKMWKSHLEPTYIYDTANRRRGRSIKVTKVVSVKWYDSSKMQLLPPKYIEPPFPDYDEISSDNDFSYSRDSIDSTGSSGSSDSLNRKGQMKFND